MFSGIGMPELLVILIIALIIFGPGKLPKVGSALGKTIGEFKKAANALPEDQDSDSEKKSSGSGDDEFSG